jgi:ABC-2 type transport system permease protein
VSALAFARPYAAILSTRFALMLQYRTAALAGFATQCWWGVIKIMVLAAFYAADAHQPITRAQAITYVWLGQAFLALLPWGADAEIAVAAETGNVGYERLRPIDTYTLWLMRAIAWRVASASLRAVPMFAVAGVLVPLFGLANWAWQLPDGTMAGVLFVISMGLTVLLASTFTVLLDCAVVALKTRRASNIAPLFVNFLSGMIVPLALLPQWSQPFLFWQPFSGLVDIPYRIYFGNLAGAAAIAGLAAQLLWVCVFVAIGRIWLSYVMARIDMQGS